MLYHAISIYYKHCYAFYDYCYTHICTYHITRVAGAEAPAIWQRLGGSAHASARAL